MKTIFVFLVSFFLLRISYSQSLPEFAPIGATWYYHNQWMTPNFTYREFISVDDTIVNGKACKRINDGEDHYLYNDSLHLYYFNTEANRWALLADFSKQVGDSFYVDVSTTQLADSFAAVIIKKGDTILNGYNLPYILVDNSWSQRSVIGNNYVYGNKIIQNIGSEIFLFPRKQEIDMDTYQLRCYNDINLGIYKNPDFHFGLWSCDTVTTSIIEHNTVTNRLNFFPNPAEDKVLFNFSRNPFEEGILLISDIYGRILKKSIIRKEQTTYQFDLINYSSGIYVYQFIDATGETSVSKFVEK